MSDHPLAFLNHANENEFIGALICWEQLPLEVILEGHTILAVSNIEDRLGVWLQPVGLPKSHDEVIEH